MPATTIPPQRRGLRKWQWLAILWILSSVAAFLVGYFPQYQRAGKLSADLKSAQTDEQQLRTQSQVAGVREQFSRAYLETTRNNFGLASQYASKGFDQLSAIELSISDPTLKQAFHDDSGRRAVLLAELSKADSNSRNDLAAILDTLYKAASH